MLRRHRQLRTQVNQIRDAALFALALYVAHWVRLYLPWARLGLEPVVEDFEQFVWLYLIVLPGAPLVLESLGFYKRPTFSGRRNTAWILLKGCFLVTVGVILMMFLLRMQLARSVIILFGFISFFLVYLHEEFVRTLYRSRLAREQISRSFLLLGAPEDTARLRADLARHPQDELHIAAELELNEQSVDRLPALLHEHCVNGVIINAKHTYFGQIESAVQACELEGVEVWLVADFLKTKISRTTFDDLYGRPMMVFRSSPEISWQGMAKQTLDFLGALTLILLFSPFFIIAALLIKLTSPGPILFRQQRCGLNGRPFMMLKFRSMVTNAEQRKHELAALNEMSGPVFKVTNDPRVTWVGRRLRKFSIDEFPQLLNVLRGEMSLVGPRPLPVDEVKRFDDPAHRRRLSVKPGLTCLWQVSGRNDVRDFSEWVRLDLEYIDNWSIWLDLKILFRTIPVVLTGSGAK